MTCLYSDTLLESSRADMAEAPLKKPSWKTTWEYPKCKNCDHVIVLKQLKTNYFEHILI